MSEFFSDKRTFFSFLSITWNSFFGSMLGQLFSSLKLFISLFLMTKVKLLSDPIWICFPTI